MANININMSNVNKAKSASFAQKVQEQIKQDPSFKKDVIEATQTLSQPSAPLKKAQDFALNPLAGNPPASGLAPLPPKAHEVLFTLFDAIKSMSDAESANSLTMNDDVNAISRESNRIAQLGNKIEAFQNAQSDIQKALKKEAHHDKILGYVEQAVFGAAAIAFATLIAGPAGFVAATLVVAANTTLQDTGAYDKMTKGMTPAEAFGVKLGISIVMGAIAGGIAGGGIYALENVAEEEGETVASNLGRSGLKTAATNVMEDTVSGTVNSSDTTVTNLEGAVNTVANDSEEILEDVVEEQGEDKLEETINSGGKSDEPAGGVKTKSIRLKRRAGWMALNAFQTMATGASSKSKGADGSYSMIGDLVKALHGSDNLAKGIGLGFSVGMMIAETGLGAWAMNGAEAAESVESPTIRIMRQASKVGLALQPVAGLGSGLYGMVSSFTQRDQFKDLGELAEQLGIVDKESESAELLQTLFNHALESSTRTNQEMMNTVFSLVHNLNTALGAAAGSQAA